jgi:hypothetical protein
MRFTDTILTVLRQKYNLFGGMNMKRNKRSSNNIPVSKKLKRELAALNDLDRINPYALYNGGFEPDEDAADYYAKKSIKAVRLG